MDKENHAQSNARASYENIAEMVAALECDYERLEELRDERAGLVQELKEAKEAYAAATVDERMDGELGDAEQEAEKALAEWDAESGEELADLTKAATLDGDLLEDAETARERIQERPLSVQVRSGWVNVGEAMEAAEFEILLTTGGPALRIVGELDEHKEPYRAWLEYQDWGTPWTRLFSVEQDTLLSFCRCFYFGD